MTYIERTIPKISLKDKDKRREEIKEQLFYAAKNIGFFTLCEQDCPSREDIEEMFRLSQKFFGLSHDVKMKTPHIKLLNSGFESCSQIRPSTGTADQKESLQLQYHRINQNWPAEEDVGKEWREKTKAFMEKCQHLSDFVMELFAEALGYPTDFFTKAHIISSDTAQTTLRLLHYFDTSGKKFDGNFWRAGPHTDFDCLTLLFQRTGDHGLEVCPGREAHTDFGYSDKWTPVPSKTGDIVINIGDMLMSWSDDILKSNFHRVRLPTPDENQGDRYTIAYFNQANTDVVIQGPLKKYPPVTGKEFIEEAMRKNFERLQNVT
ncbi:hypothetical protein KL918_005286 [Ogataea parapolymorpha]|uniref:Fe2OG dioxygenase domain-containing protein n=1 Tax=Ogataea parapolymorpha (strain ATCC 26012 / BCRC 20466 / JCM 22074 / NRRL Y-7560 / DL-1) TaxID=871575 RepID=W1QEK3_OGAPD|nr:hypothetical protein HPODL_00896 [Ogataea parapolymorpha DL-1]XP_018211046.1 uncharacterized protein OGAPODRAFT_82825 [Ogataea polymorpha]KAG7864795.1 hypothetical protein KL918_005286 [Ogataea parapolymorpha]ESX00007.1 hypothetical protein HPODL_00896 [Ogataea parapolymorpha DL-1]KAG7870995.1 hypothetical protein KL916_004546 [Ogataea parapolymorpha]KAG7930109.1 hypothetical protein KL934_005221 [Ogataea polymorpha]OBA16105.1 hypothetical protein OGAPODRAFT_82825 [Ogataea polymorpha]